MTQLYTLIHTSQEVDWEIVIIDRHSTDGPWVKGQNQVRQTAHLIPADRTNVHSACTFKRNAAMDQREVDE